MHLRAIFCSGLRLWVEKMNLTMTMLPYTNANALTLTSAPATRTRQWLLLKSDTPPLPVFDSLQAPTLLPVLCLVMHTAFVYFVTK